MSKPARSRGWVTIGAVVLVALVLGAFLVGRGTASSGTRTAKPASDTIPANAKAAALSRAAVTTTTLAPVNIDEIAENQPDQPLDPPTRTELSLQLVVARTAAMQYPTVATARAAGMIQAGKFAPELGAHFISYANLGRELLPDGSVNAQYPVGYIYDGISPTSKVVGLMYVSIAGGPAPSGFAGPNDHWHRHSNLCIQYQPGGKIAVPFAPDRDVTRAECETVHGDFMKRTVWMVHAWVVPGWESPKGVFSHADPDLRCANGTVTADAVGFCRGT